MRQNERGGGREAHGEERKTEKRKSEGVSE